MLASGNLSAKSARLAWSSSILPSTTRPTTCTLRASSSSDSGGAFSASSAECTSAPRPALSAMAIAPPR